MTTYIMTLMDWVPVLAFFVAIGFALGLSELIFRMMDRRKVRM
jgi:hypothetical protein